MESSADIILRNVMCMFLHDAGEQSNAPPAARPGPPAKDYTFTLDPFQQTAINCLETGAAVSQLCTTGWRVEHGRRNMYRRALQKFCKVKQTCGIYAGHSVLVSAHTSAGKTVVAEYAFAMALR